MQSGLANNAPVCPKCRSWAYYISNIDGKPLYQCRDCSYKKKMYKTDWMQVIKVYLSRFCFWK